MLTIYINILVNQTRLISSWRVQDFRRRSKSTRRHPCFYSPIGYAIAASPGARLAILPAANAHELGGFVRAAVRPESHVVSDDFKGYVRLHGADRQHPVVHGDGTNAERFMPIVRVLFSNVKTWLNGTYHGVSAKHLPRYAREWNYRFNRRAESAS